MTTFRLFFSVVLVCSLGVSTTLAQGLPPQAPPTTHPQIFTTPLQTSDPFVIPIQVQAPFAVTNWAGMVLRLHHLDATEADVTTITSTLGGVTPVDPVATPPLGPPSANLQTVPKTFNAWHPAALASGTVRAGGVSSSFGVTIQGKNTTVAGNGDVDMTAAWGNIYHLLSGLGSTTAPPSWFVWASSAHLPTPLNPLPAVRPTTNDPNARWVNIPFSWQIPSAPGLYTGSHLIATFNNNVYIGVEHDPIPVELMKFSIVKLMGSLIQPGAGVLMMVGGVFCVRMARRKRIYGAGRQD